MTIPFVLNNLTSSAPASLRIPQDHVPNACSDAHFQEVCMHSCAIENAILFPNKFAVAQTADVRGAEQENEDQCFFCLLWIGLFDDEDARV